MTRTRLSLPLLLLTIVVSSCGVQHTAGDANPAAEQSSATHAAASPCDLLTVEQQESLGVGAGQDGASPVEGAAFCTWRPIVRNGDSFRAGLYPERVSLANVEQNYDDPHRVVVAGLSAVSVAPDAAVAQRGCMIFAERPGGGLVVVSYFWEGDPSASTHELACSRATTAFEMALTTLRSR